MNQPAFLNSHLRKITFIGLVFLLLSALIIPPPIIFSQDNPTETPAETETLTPPPTETAVETELPTIPSPPTETATFPPTETATELPTEAPTPLTTEEPTPITTDEPTPISSEEPTGTLTTTPATPTLTVTPPEPSLTQLIGDSFESNYFAPWMISGGWSLIPHDNGQALQVFNIDEYVQYSFGSYRNVAAQASFWLNSAAAQLSVRRSSFGVYTASLDVNGTVSLYRWTTLLQSAVISPLSGQWHTLRISALEDVIRVSVDGVEVISVVDTDPLPTGAITFGASGLGENDLFVDDVVIWGSFEEANTLSANKRELAKPVAQSGSIITVNTSNQENPFLNNGNCTLGEAIVAANTNLPKDGCAAGSGNDTIQFSASVSAVDVSAVYETTPNGANAFPLISTPITIASNGTVIIQRNPLASTPKFRLFEVASSGSLTLSGVKLRGGNVTGSGGAVYSSGVLTINSGSTIGGSGTETNTASSSGGGITNFSGDLSVVSSTISFNRSNGNSGGGIFSNKNLTISDSFVLSNIVSGIFSNGGGIYTLAGFQPVEVIRTLISSNSASGSPGGSGGGISFPSGGQLNIRASTISNNTASDNGGGILSDGGGPNTGTLNILENSIISKNVATNIGGGIFLRYRNLIVDSSVIGGATLADGNTARGGGGIIGNIASIVTIQANSRIENNKATLYDSGGVGANTISVLNSVIANNRALTVGGGISAENLTINNSVILSNRVDGGNGGGIYATQSLNINNSRIERNLASTNASVGGGIYYVNNVNPNAIVNNSCIALNTANEGGGIYSTGSFNAQNNWWGDINGPTINQFGRGDAIKTPEVTFTPFLTSLPIGCFSLTGAFIDTNNIQTFGQAGIALEVYIRAADILGTQIQLRDIFGFIIYKAVNNQGFSSLRQDQITEALGRLYYEYGKKDRSISCPEEFNAAQALYMQIPGVLPTGFLCVLGTASEWYGEVLKAEEQAYLIAEFITNQTTYNDFKNRAQLILDKSLRVTVPSNCQVWENGIEFDSAGNCPWNWGNYSVLKNNVRAQTRLNDTLNHINTTDTLSAPIYYDLNQTPERGIEWKFAIIFRPGGNTSGITPGNINDTDFFLLTYFQFVVLKCRNNLQRSGNFPICVG